MNIESVKKLIASLEAAGELTIKERIYLYSMKEHIALAEENSLMRKLLPDYISVPATDNFLASLRAEARKQGAIFAANRMLAAWDAGFVDDTPENAADIARAILSMTEFMDDAPEGDFDRSFADEMLTDIAAQLRSQSEQVKGVQS